MFFLMVEKCIAMYRQLTFAGPQESAGRIGDELWIRARSQDVQLSSVFVHLRTAENTSPGHKLN